MCPGESEFVQDTLFGHKEQSSNNNTLLIAIANSYMTANTQTLRRQLLSIAANEYSCAEVKLFIPSLTKYQFYCAKKYAKNIGVGIPLEYNKVPRMKIDEGQLDHFLDFITSNHIVKDLPIGEKTLQLSTGELIQTPNVIRSLASATIIRQYTTLCEEENIKPLGR